jgi:YjbR
MKLDALVGLVKTLPEVRQSEHVETPDFRVAGKIFATLPSSHHLVLKLTPEQQGMVMQSDPAMFSAVEGAWGDRGWTNAEIAKLDDVSALSALIMAWTNVATPSIRARTAGEMPRRQNRA